jgi:MoaA/NifB/PqqE/SkfB family radical SAM enzyme
MTTTPVPTLPRSIYIEPTSRCNELCQQCPRTLLSREEDRDLSFREVYLQRLVYFERGLAHSRQALFRRATSEELELVRRCEQICKERGIAFKAAGSATPLESLLRESGDRPWSGCRRPYTLTYITSSGNVLSCCFAPFGHMSAREYQEERVLGNIFQEPLEAIWHGERYGAFRRAFESDHPATHCSQCGLNWSY